MVFPVFFGCISFLKYSISEKPEDCVKGKQYWSTSSVITSKGSCIKCPPNWRTCFGQPIDDQASCVLSCRVNPTPKPKSKTTPTTTIPFQPTPSKVPKITINSNGSLAVVYQSAKHPPEVNERQTSHVFKEGLGKELWIAIGCCGLFVLILIIVVIVLYHEIRKKRVGYRSESVKLNGIQEPEEQENFSSSLNIDQNHY